MKKIIGSALISLVAASSLQASDFSGFVKYMYAGATNDSNTIDKSSNVVGIELSYEHDIDEKFSTKFTLMSVNPVGNDNDCSRIIGSKYTGTDGFNVLGEVFVKYEDDNSQTILGRQKINTPLLASNFTKMSYQTLLLSGTYEALRYQRDLESGSIDFDLITKYKQRTSDKFYDLGENITGDTTSLDMDYVSLMGYTNSYNGINYQVWDMEAENLTNTIYADASYSKKYKGINFTFAAQVLDQNIDSTSRNISTPEKTVDDSSLIGAKISLAKNGSKLMLAVSKTGDNQIILPWDGSPTFTKICVTNAITRSIKGAGLVKYDGAYMANTMGYKAAYIQSFARFGMPNLKSVIAYAKYSPDAKSVDQINKMAYLTYDMDGIFNGMTISAAYTQIDNFDARSIISGVANPTFWTVQEGQDYTHYKLIINYSF
jgi:hypothetical protein